MSDATPDFAFDMKGVDRQALLLDAAKRLDNLQGHLGPGDVEKGSTAIGQQTRLFSEDQAEFADNPVMYKITDEYFLLNDKKVPYSFKQLSEHFNFYWIDIPLKLHPKGNWAFNEIKVEIEFNPQAPKDGTRPKAYQVLPDEEFIEKLRLYGQVEAQLGEDFKLSAHLPTLSTPVGATPIVASLDAGADAALTSNVGIAIPRHVYSFKVDKLSHSGLGAEDVWWHMKGKEFSRENKPQLSVIVQVLKEIQEFTIRAEMETSRYLHFAPANLQEAVQELPRAVREFFKKGLPIYATPPGGLWNMTRFL
jgi:hypothetical protein